MAVCVFSTEESEALRSVVTKLEEHFLTVAVGSYTDQETLGKKFLLHIGSKLSLTKDFFFRLFSPGEGYQ